MAEFLEDFSNCDPVTDHPAPPAMIDFVLEAIIPYSEWISFAGENFREFHDSVAIRESFIRKTQPGIGLYLSYFAHLCHFCITLIVFDSLCDTNTWNE